jgi:rubrerythrin
MKEDDIPVYWTCECGWSGSVDEMTKPDYTCPICDDYDLQIFLPFNEDLI